MKRSKEKERAMRHGLSALVAAFVAAILGLSSEPVRAEAVRAAVFDLGLLDSSQEGEINGVRADETKRLADASQRLREMLAERGVELVDLAPVAEALDKAGDLRKCKNCDIKLARELGADIAVTGFVQKVSNLILNINIYIRDAGTGETLRGGSTDIRGNTDESWFRGVSYLVRNRLLEKPIEAKAGP